MNSKNRLILVLAFLFSFVACSDDAKDTRLNSATVINISTTDLLNSALAGSKSIEVIADGDWVVLKTEDEWFSVSPSQGSGNGSITVLFDENAGEPRNGIIVVKSVHTKKEVKLTQASKTSELEVTGNLNFETLGGSLSAVLTSTKEWKVEHMPDWISVDRLSGTGDATLTVTVSANTSDIVRVGDIVITGGVTRTIVVTQQYTEVASDLSTNKSHLIFTADGKSEMLKVTAIQKAWTIEFPSWVESDFKEGSGNAEVNFVVKANLNQPRSGVIKFTMGSLVREVTVDQWSPTEGVINARGDGKLVLAVFDVSGTAIDKLTVRGKLAKGVGMNLDDAAAVATISKVKEIDMSEAELLTNNLPDDWYKGKEVPVSIRLPKPSMTVTSLGNRTFEDCANLETVVIPEGYSTVLNNKNSVKSVFAGCVNLKNIQLPKSIAKITENQFKGCISLQSIVIPEGVEAIEYAGFVDCANLTSVTLPSTLTYIGQDVFARTAIATIDFPESLKTIGQSAFLATPLTELYIPKSVEKILDNAFYNCRKMVKLTIEGAPKLSGNIFDNAYALTSVILLSSVPPECYIATAPFNTHRSELLTLYVPEGSLSTYKLQQFWREFVNITTLN